MFGLGLATRIYIAVEGVDMRKGFEGLHGLVRDHLENQGQHQITPFLPAGLPHPWADVRAAAGAGPDPTPARPALQKLRCPRGTRDALLREAAPPKPRLPPRSVAPRATALHCNSAAIGPGPGDHPDRPRGSVPPPSTSGTTRRSPPFRRAPGSFPHRRAPARRGPHPKRNCRIAPARGGRSCAVPGSRSARNRCASVQRPAPGSVAFGHDHEMHVIAHQAVPPDAQAVAGGVIEECLQIYLAITVREKDGLAAVAALRDVVRGVHCHGSWCSRHTHVVAQRGKDSQRNGVIWCCPWFSRRLPTKMRLSPFHPAVLEKSPTQRCNQSGAFLCGRKTESSTLSRCSAAYRRVLSRLPSACKDESE